VTQAVFSRSVRAPETVLIRELADGESVLLDMATERYYGLDESGTAMWLALTSSASIQQAYERLLEEYIVDADVLCGDLQRLLEELVDGGLLEFRGD
jgi:hypothetical protein